MPIKSARLVLALLVAAWSLAAVADPPAHAPAHGWRKKHDPYYVGYNGARWERDYEITDGRCNRQEIATVVGAVAGGAIASRVAKPENRTVATIVGAIAGALIGNHVGRELDEADRGCLGHALEIGEAGRRVTWKNDAVGVRYELLPGAVFERAGMGCREFTLVTVADGKKSSQQGVACQAQPGVWQLAN